MVSVQRRDELETAAYCILRAMETLLAHAVTDYSRFCIFRLKCFSIDVHVGYIFDYKRLKLRFKIVNQICGGLFVSSIQRPVHGAEFWNLFSKFNGVF